MKNIFFIAILILFASAQIKSEVKGRITLEFLPGYASTLPMPLTVYQNGNKVFSETAIYETRSLEMPIYYSYRIGYLKARNGWELEMNHLKIYLKNTNDVLTHFSVSHGYNQLWFNHVWMKPYGILRLGVGPVITHDETTVNGKRLEETGGFFNNGYHLHGIGAQIAYQKRIMLYKFLFVSGEAKLSFGYARVDVVDGYAHAPTIAGHLLIGAGVEF